METPGVSAEIVSPVIVPDSRFSRQSWMVFPDEVSGPLVNPSVEYPNSLHKTLVSNTDREQTSLFDRIGYETSQEGEGVLISELAKAVCNEVYITDSVGKIYHLVNKTAGIKTQKQADQMLRRYKEGQPIDQWVLQVKTDENTISEYSLNVSEPLIIRNNYVIRVIENGNSTVYSIPGIKKIVVLSNQKVAGAPVLSPSISHSDVAINFWKDKKIQKKSNAKANILPMDTINLEKLIRKFPIRRELLEQKSSEDLLGSIDIRLEVSNNPGEVMTTEEVFSLLLGRRIDLVEKAETESIFLSQLELLRFIEGRAKGFLEQQMLELGVSTDILQYIPPLYYKRYVQGTRKPDSHLMQSYTEQAAKFAQILVDPTPFRKLSIAGSIIHEMTHSARPERVVVKDHLSRTKELEFSVLETGFVSNGKNRIVDHWLSTVNELKFNNQEGSLLFPYEMQLKKELLEEKREKIDTYKQSLEAKGFGSITDEELLNFLDLPIIFHETEQLNIESYLLGKNIATLIGYATTNDALWEYVSTEEMLEQGWKILAKNDYEGEKTGIDALRNILTTRTISRKGEYRDDMRNADYILNLEDHPNRTSLKKANDIIMKALRPCMDRRRDFWKIPANNI
ncbi:MAG TPA: hypothetical protein VLF89_02195 [Candidatus Saccharimonadales bacterium]|nr:hypothetical protein [Candidatus Saccharimonadales bacterium]